MLSRWSSKEVVINHLAREGLDLVGSSDGYALLDFVDEYLCGNDSDDNEDDLSSGEVPFQ